MQSSRRSRVAEDVSRLFDEYAARYARGERPDARAYLERAGEGREELVTLLDRFLALAPAPEPDDDLVAMMRAWAEGEPPLLELRTRRGVRRAALVDALVERLGLDPKKREKVGRYVHELESGHLDPDRVDRRVFAVWAETLRARVEDLVTWRPRPAAPQAAYLRSNLRVAASLPVPEPSPAGPDEIDKLFTGSR
jgi:hypothetical protein